jgi:3-deoxy-D-arabino-heptulosonate 7-phosphate (DAHP) synthase
MIEVHDRPQDALSDGAQAVLPAELKKIIKVSDLVHKAIRESESPFSSDVSNAPGRT